MGERLLLKESGVAALLLLASDQSMDDTELKLQAAAKLEQLGMMVRPGTRASGNLGN